MSDVNYRIQTAAKSPRLIAAYRAVLYPLYGLGGWRHDQRSASLTRLVQRRRARIGDLVEADVYDAGYGKSHRDLDYARNCPPLGWRQRGARLTCNRATLCPFCYARRLVMPAFDSLAAQWAEGATLTVSRWGQTFRGIDVDVAAREAAARRLPRLPPGVVQQCWPVLRADDTVLLRVTMLSFTAVGPGRSWPVPSLWALGRRVGAALALPGNFLNTPAAAWLEVVAAFHGRRLLNRPRLPRRNSPKN